MGYIIMKKTVNEGSSNGSSEEEKLGLTFETSLESLEAIVRDLERGQLSLDDSLAQFSDATKHLRFCYAALESAQRKVSLLREVLVNGEPILDSVEDFRQDVSAPRHGRAPLRDASSEL